MLIRKLFIFIATLLACSCAQVTSLNLKKHQFGRIPTRIIWMQVAGLTPEHIAMLKYSSESARSTTSFEKSLCVGNSWNYNLYQMRPSAYNSFQTQLVGKKNIKGKCTDYKQKPIWKYLNKKGYKIGVFEGESITSKTSLLGSLRCSEGKDYLEDTTFWSMSSKKGSAGKSRVFHANENINFKKNHIYYDKSCSKGECYTTFSRNVESIYKSFKKNANNHLFLIRNFTFLEKLKKKKIKDAREELNQINLALNFFQKESRKNTNTLVLLTSAEALDIDMPRSGKEWEKYEKNGRFVKIKKSNLASTVFATGARAENFCGIYDQSQILPRIFSGSKQQGLEFSIINPFE